jgi:glycosyltransferase involved in cell wall biosynthesis
MPPVQGSSGVQRTLRFAQHLPKFGWQPIVLSVAPRAYEATSNSAGNELPPGVEIVRAFGLDTGRHLSLFGRYPRSLALPDRWATWRWRGVPLALDIIRRRDVSVVWSTFPISTAHCIGIEVARRSGLPWVAEFRDPMWQGHYPPDPAVNDYWRNLEKRIFERAHRVVVTAPSALSVYRERFPNYPATQVQLIENGYDEETFQRAAGLVPTAARPSVGRPGTGPVTLLHSGLVYRGPRDPTQLFAALAALKARKMISAERLRIVFRASGDEAHYLGQLQALGIDDIVQLEPSVDYLAALREMLTVDGLLILQASSCNAQVPAKLFEYLRAERPILALTDPVGDTARTLEAAGAGLVARLDSQHDIERALPAFLEQIEQSTWRRPGQAAIERYSRESQAGQLARLLDDVAGEAPRP